MVIYEQGWGLRATKKQARRTQHFSSSGFLVWCADHFPTFPLSHFPIPLDDNALLSPHLDQIPMLQLTDTTTQRSPPPPTFFSKVTFFSKSLFLKVLINNRSGKRLLFIFKLQVSIVFPTIITIKVYKTKGTVL